MGDDRNPPDSCFSYVGMVQGKNQGKGQLVNLGLPRCLNIGIILHQTLHALGLLFSLLLEMDIHIYISGAVHEHPRQDRDLFVFILHGNIQPNTLHNFLKVTSETHSTMNTPFDASSLMMYGPNDFGIMDSSGRRTTIKPVNPVQLKSGNRMEKQKALFVATLYFYIHLYFFCSQTEPVFALTHLMNMANMWTH